MGCSIVIAFVSFSLLAGIGLYVGGGIAGLSGTLDLFTQYGPVKGRGNPALDDPPDMWVNPDTGKWEPRNPNNPGNRVPLAFEIVKYILIGWAVVVFISSVIFIIDSLKSKKAIQNRIYKGTKTSDSALSCTAWLTGYSVFLMIVWLVMAGFAVLPLLEYRITMQRCWDLENPNFSPTSKRAICVDLVQYGLVLFRETDDDGFALMCGPGGNYDPPRGDLEGFCAAYSTTFVSFVLCFTGACIGMIGLVLFAIHHSSNFAYLKVRRYESAPSRYYLGPGPTEHVSRKDPELSRTSSLSDHVDYHVPSHHGVNLANPNYGSSIPDSHQLQPKVPEVMSFRQYRPEEEDIEMHAIKSSTNYRHLDSGNESTDDDSGSVSPPAYDDDDTESRRSRHRHADRRHRRKNRHHRDGDGDRSYRGSEVTDRRHRHKDSEEELDPRWSSDEGRSRRSRRSRDVVERRDESPSSDYYVSEDKQRRSSTRWG